MDTTVDASGGADSWAKSPELRELMLDSVRKSKTPTLFFQAQNDFDLSPSEILSKEMHSLGKINEVKFYPKYGETAKDGHSFAFLGASIWFDDVIRFIEKPGNCF